MIDYISMLGIDLLAASSGNGYGARVAVLDSGTPKPWSGVNNVCSRCDRKVVFDTLGHATAVASILAGGTRVSGICKGAEISYIPVIGEDGTGSADSVSDGIYKAIDADVDIINVSVGFLRTKSCPRRLRKACQAAFDAKKVVICAAGNDGGQVNWPAALDTTISVGSTDKGGIKTSFSSTGEVDFVAPGANLYVMTPEGGVKKTSGTSFSAAIVSGVAALLVAGMKLPCHSPGMNSVMSALKCLATDVDEPGWDKMTGYGEIGGTHDGNLVCMKMKTDFFGRIINKLKSFVGLNNKENRNGSVV